MSESTKNYAQGMFVYEKQHGDKPPFFSIEFNLAQFVEWAQQIADETGRVRVTMSRRREIIPKKPTHSVFEDTWKPDPSRRREPAPQSQESSGGDTPF